MRYDMHVHTRYSRCSNLDTDDIIRICMKKGLDGIGAVDHDMLKGALELKKKAKGQMDVIIGQEVSTDKGHVIGFNINEELRKKELLEVLEEIRDQGGVSVIAHPFRMLPHLRFKEDLNEIKNRFDAIEGLNGRVIFRLANAHARNIAIKLGKPITGGSDAHFTYEIGDCVSIFDGDFASAVKKNSIKVEGKSFYDVKGIIGGFHSFLLKRVR